jgi:hypothetical protein
VPLQVWYVMGVGKRVYVLWEIDEEVCERCRRDVCSLNRLVSNAR